MAVAKKLDYRPNRVAVNLRSNRSNIIALIVSDIENPFFQRVSRAVEDAAYEKGYSVMLCNNDENPDKEKMYLNLMRDENVAGIILSPTRQTSIDFKAACNIGIPMVVIDRAVTNCDVDNVLINNAQSAHTIVAHLIDHGYKRIGGIFGIDTTTGQERKEGYLRALCDHGVNPLPALIKHTSPREEAGFDMAIKLLDLPEPPRAIFASNSMLAAGALRALRERKILIPDEVAFASFDETTWTRLLVPALTVVEQPTYEIGRTATKLLLDRIKDPARSTREVILQSKLIVRESCGCLKK